MAQSEKEFIRNFLGMHRQMERLLNEAFQHGNRPSPSDSSSWSPAADVYETREGFVVRMEIAGLDESQFYVTFEDGRLIVEGVRGDIACTEQAVCHRMEIPYGPFRRVIAISREVDPAGVTAQYSQGFLTIRLPRSGAPNRKTLRIETE